MNVCILGVDFANDNLGCQALGYSCLKILSDISEERKEKLIVSAIVYNDNREAVYDKNKIIMSYICIRPKKLSFYKAYKRAIKEADFVIDFTGGDSFSDIYGVKNFIRGSVLKDIAIHSKTPFVLGPQTIGPFYKSWIKKWGARIIKKSDYVFVRDEKSLMYTEELTGIIPILTTDVAFALPYNKQLAGTSNKKKVGINPSGLLWFENKSFESKKYVSVDYEEYLTKVISYLAKDEKYEIHLIPHVFSVDSVEYDENCTSENDIQACFRIKKLFPNVIVEKGIMTPMDAKSVISSMDVFTGARMHATIGAYSSGTPVIPFSYSRKFEGLFGSLGYEYLVNGTSMDTQTAIDKTIEWIENSDELKKAIELSMPIVNKKMEDMKSELIKIIYEKNN